MEPVSKLNFHEMNLKNQVIDYIKCEGATSGLTILHIEFIKQIEARIYITESALKHLNRILPKVDGITYSYLNPKFVMMFMQIIIQMFFFTCNSIQAV